MKLPENFCCSSLVVCVFLCTDVSHSPTGPSCCSWAVLLLGAVPLAPLLLVLGRPPPPAAAAAAGPAAPAPDTMSFSCLMCLELNTLRSSQTLTVLVTPLSSFSSPCCMQWVTAFGMAWLKAAWYACRAA